MKSLWEQLLEQDKAVEEAVKKSRALLDQMPGSWREDGINLLYSHLTEYRAKLLALAAEEGEP